MNFQNADILTTKQFDLEAITKLFSLAKEFESIAFGEQKSDLAHGKILANLFYEPSTRTRFSFEVAMKRLGGDVISVTSLDDSSLKKGETLYDTGKVVSQFSSIIAVRHPQAGSASQMAEGATVPVINCGDGPANHPSQALLDLYTIYKYTGDLSGLTICMVGDLKNSRVQHSQCDLLLNYQDLKFIFVSPETLKMPAGVTESLRAKGFSVEETSDLTAAVAAADVISSSRIQVERFPTLEEYRKNTGIFVIDAGVMSHVKEKAILLAPLPRIEEIATAVDNDPRAKYFEQVKNGVPVRMALLALVLGVRS